MAIIYFLLRSNKMLTNYANVNRQNKYLLFLTQTMTSMTEIELCQKYQHLMFKSKLCYMKL
jgi:competence protein ComGF